MSWRPPRAEQLPIDGPAGVLEALLEDPQVSPPAGFAVVCHPHPLHGGTMHNKVVHTVARACQERGMPTLRFNYRGVGASAGSYDEGRGETQDALAVIAAGRARWPGARADARRIFLRRRGEPARCSGGGSGAPDQRRARGDARRVRCHRASATVRG